IGRAFDLVRRRADAPIKILWKLSPFMHWSASIVQRFPTSLCGFTQVRIWRTGLDSEFDDVGREEKVKRPVHGDACLSGPDRNPHQVVSLPNEPRWKSCELNVKDLCDRFTAAE